MSSDRSNFERTLPQTNDDLRRAQERSLQPSRPPMSVPGYHADRFLGAGAYGQVWVAVDGNTGRKVAIKFYNHRGGLDWSLLSREVERLALLFADRYVVQLVDVGWDADPPYYVMEYLERGSLADRLEHGPLPAHEAIDLFREVATGLVHAHGKGILHCDLKPANVLLDQDGKPRLADFGQSRLSTEQVPALGTLFYMAPEQADLEAMPDARWDVYALGALLHCMLTGEPPFRDARFVSQIQDAGGLEEQLAHYRAYIRSAARPHLHRQVHGVDRELSDIVNRCLAIDPNKRFANPQAVLDALHARSVRRARRPLLVLGAVGPAVLLLVTALFLGDVLETAVVDSREALTRRALESDRFAAQFVAETVGTEIDRRWQVLEQVAARPDFRRSLAAAAGKPRDSSERLELQSLLIESDRLHPIVEGDQWFLLDSQGTQVARSPQNERSIDRNFAYRDYFQGQGRDLPRDGAEAPRPIEAPHLSILFVGETTGERSVALSVPVWSNDETDSQRTVIGVLAHSVGLGHFAELHPEERSGNDQLAVLVDGKPDFSGKAGAILEHPHIAQASKKSADGPPHGYLTPDDLRDLDQLRAMRRKLREGRHAQVSSDDVRRANELAWLEDYQDPLAEGKAERWLAAIEPVVVHTRPAPVDDTGWAIIVQERYDEAVTPVDKLRESLLVRSILAVVVLLFVVTGLWGFVVVVLNESPRFRWLRRRRRLAGRILPGLESGSELSPGSSTTTATPAVKIETSDSAPTSE
jgi:hypothetical protein